MKEESAPMYTVTLCSRHIPVLVVLMEKKGN